MSEDCTELSDLSLDSIIDNLNVRYSQNKIYTYTGHVLLAVNPYKPVPGPSDPLVYRGKSFRSNAPHPFALADAALRFLLGENRSQALVISGESGAGKTETARLILQYFTALGEQGKIGNSELIGNLVAQSTEILEAFGNAATTRNLNSSRFGKFQKLHFARASENSKFPIFHGSLIQPFLLETSRVPGVAEGERNFHVFYRLLAGLEEAELGALGFEEEDRKFVGKFPMLGAGKREISAEEDKRKWRELVRALEISGFTEEDRKFLEQAIAGIMHISAMEEISDHHMTHAARLLGLSEISLQSGFATRQVAIGNRENYAVDRSEAESEIFRRSLMRSAYSRVFEFVNRKFCKISDHSIPFIGCLDIFGFEKFPIVNGLEQLLINLVNEKLQDFFIDKVLQGERRALLAEGLVADAGGFFSQESEISSSGNIRVREISRVLEILDDHCLRRAKHLATDETKFGQQILSEICGRSEIVCATKKRENRKFLVKHFAGDVEYTVVDWIDRNNDRKFPEIDALLNSSNNPCLLSAAGSNVGAGAGAGGFSSVRRKFQESAGNLLAAISECQSYFVRCFNPNDAQISDHFDRKYVGQQLTHSGTVELVRVMREGFPCRQSLDAIFGKYGNLFEKFPIKLDKRTFAEVLMTHVFKVGGRNFRVGLNTLFLKTGLMEISDQLEISDLSQTITRLVVVRKFQRAVHAVRAVGNLSKQISVLRRARFLRLLNDRLFLPVLAAKRAATVLARFARTAVLAKIKSIEIACEAEAAANAAKAAAEALAAETARAESEISARISRVSRVSIPEGGAIPPTEEVGEASETVERSESGRRSEISGGERRKVELFAADGEGGVQGWERGTWKFVGGEKEFPIKRQFVALGADVAGSGRFVGADRENGLVVWKFFDSGVVEEAKFSIRGGDNFQTKMVRFYDRKFLCVVVEQKGKKFPMMPFPVRESPRDVGNLMSKFVSPAGGNFPRREISESQFYMILLEIGKFSKFSVHSTIALGVPGSIPQTLGFLEMSGNFLVAGGRGCLQFMQTRKIGNQMKLEMIGNQNSFKGLAACSFTCALFVGNAEIFVGCAAGNIYRFVLDENGNFSSEECGRLRQGADGGLSGKRIVSLVPKKGAFSRGGFLVFTACGWVEEWSEKSADGRWTRIGQHGKMFASVTSVKETSDEEVAVFDGKNGDLFSFSKQKCTSTPISFSKF